MTTSTTLGLRVVGIAAGTRRLVDHATAFRAHCQLDERAEPARESYLSIFTFPREFRKHFEANRTEAAYNGPCGASAVWWDIDRPDDLERALRDSRRLAAFVLDQFAELDDADLLIFFSGAKGFHVGLPTSWRPEPTPSLHVVAKRFCETIAEAAGVAIDPSVYSKTRLFRSPNSRHAKTGLYKRRLTYDELLHLRLEAIVALAREPAPFELPTGPPERPSLAAAWRRAREAVEGQAVEQRRYVADGPKLARATLEFIRDGAADGERELRTFRAAANLAEFGCPGALAFALLEESALDSGLSPKEARKAIDGGLRHGRQQGKGAAQ